MDRNNDHVFVIGVYVVFWRETRNKPPVFKLRKVSSSFVDKR